MDIVSFFKPSDITIFAVIKRPTEEGKGILIGVDGHNLVAFPGGKVEACHATLMDALEEELNDEIGATLNPANFGNPAFNLNCVLAHPTPLVFYTVTYRRSATRRTEVQKQLRNPLKFVQEMAAKAARGEPVEPYDIKARVIVLLHELTRRKPKEVLNKQGRVELSKLAYKGITPKSNRKLREMVRITLKKTLDGRWNNRPTPSAEWPWKLNLKFLRKQWTKDGMFPEWVDKYAPEPAPKVAEPFRFQPKHQENRLVCMAV